MDDQTNNSQTLPADAAQPDQDFTELHEVTSDQPVDDDTEMIEAIRQQAVDALIPIVDSVEGTPEYKFEMLMNAVESVPNPVLLQKAMDAANQIEDPSVKAQALVDLLNLTNSI